MSYSIFKEKAILVANNRLLKDWSVNADRYTCDQYTTIMNNLRYWLAPTAYRLSNGLNLLLSYEPTGDKSYINDVIHAFKHNIEDEKGDCKNNSHAFLFNQSAAEYSNVVYKKDLQFSKGIAISNELKLNSEKLFSEDIFVMLGASLAQEIHALPQLELLYKGKSILRNKFSDSDWHKVSYFYDIHLDGTEARHAEDLNRTIWSLIDSKDKELRFSYGFNELLSNLNLFWSEIYKGIQ